MFVQNCVLSVILYFFYRFSVCYNKSLFIWWELDVCLKGTKILGYMLKSIVVFDTFYFVVYKILLDWQYFIYQQLLIYVLFARKRFILKWMQIKLILSTPSFNFSLILVSTLAWCIITCITFNTIFVHNIICFTILLNSFKLIIIISFLLSSRAYFSHYILYILDIL